MHAQQACVGAEWLRQDEPYVLPERIKALRTENSGSQGCAAIPRG